MTDAEREAILRDEAIEWFVRLQEADDELLWTAHRAWLEADPAHRRADAAIRSLWVDLDLQAVAWAARGASAPSAAVHQLRRRGGPSRAAFVGWAAAAAAVATIAIFVPRPISPVLNPSQTYRTDGSHLRTIALQDGSKLYLNRNTVASVRVGPEARFVALRSGEAAFDIRHERRPFTVLAGTREIRVLGTEFNVLDQQGAFAVTVRRGVVSVSASESSAPPVRVAAGQALVRPAGAATDAIRQVDPEAAFAWRTGRLVFVDRPLPAVASALSRYMGGTIEVSPDLMQTHVTAILAIGSAAHLRRQLEGLAPVRFERRGQGWRLQPATPDAPVDARR